MTLDERFPVVPTAHVEPCTECKTVTRAPVAIRWIQGTSSSGRTLYACPVCAPKLGAGPTPDDVIR